METTTPSMFDFSGHAAGCGWVLDHFPNGDWQAKYVLAYNHLDVDQANAVQQILNAHNIGAMVSHEGDGTHFALLATIDVHVATSHEMVLSELRMIHVLEDLTRMDLVTTDMLRSAIQPVPPAAIG